MSLRRRRANSRENEVPFGIRAIESGIEVEGVWISRNNSEASLPVHSRDTSGSSSSWDHVPRKDFSTDIEKLAMNTNQDRPGSNSSKGITSNPRYYANRNASTDRLSSSRTSRDDSPNSAMNRPTKSSRHPPVSYSRYSGNPALIRTGSAASTLSALEAIQRASGPIDMSSTAEDSFGSNSSNGPSDSAPISASAPNLLTHQPESRPRKQSADLDMMHSHPMSQAAETGQLTPRVRKPSHGGEWNGDSVASTPHSAPFPEQGDYFTSEQRSASPTPPPSPKIGSLPAGIRNSSLPDVTPFTTFCQTGPGYPLADRSRSSSSSDLPNAVSHTRTLSAPTSTTKPFMGLGTTPSSAPSSHPQPSTSISVPPAEPRFATSTFSRDPSSVLRGHGTGFEILRPGTLKAPPVSLQNGHHSQGNKSRDGSADSIRGGGRRSRSSSADSRRKLQKKRGRLGSAVSVASTVGSEVDMHPGIGV
jgi:hypothetical protein